MPLMTLESSKVLLCAATRWEAEPLAAALGLSKAATPGRWEGLLGEREVVLVRTGIGPTRAGERLLELSEELFGLALSVGFAGALQPKMGSGDIVCDVRGSDADLPAASREIAARLGVPIHFGKIAHSDVVVGSPEDKRRLGAALRASAVDMETQALRSWADERELPVLAVRVVLDSVDDALPREVPAGEDLASLASFALRNLPRLPRLIALGVKQRRAIGRLAGFLKELLPKL